MKKLSLWIALGSLCLLSFAKPALNVAQFETYSQQMYDLSTKYIQNKQFQNADKTISVWLNTYNTFSDKEKANYAPLYAKMQYNYACALAQNNDLYQALKALEEAVDAGFNNKEQATTDPNLSGLKNYDSFQKILSNIKS
ncbi:MAG: hypothetical protein R2739_09860 [Chitinophagales bacterium]|nr:hypothetical protein [Bacteroidota bacterium]